MAADQKKGGSSKKTSTVKSSGKSTKKKTSAKTGAPTPEPAFPIVGIGASAGGLDALKKFFGALPENPGMAFVVVVHLDPSHISILPDLLQRSSRLKVQSVEDGAQVQPNNVYVAPPKKDVAILNQTLQLLDPVNAKGRRLPIDFFLRQLAKDLMTSAACVIFSGTGSDGTSGLKEIKGEGGLVLAQDEASAEYDGMPRSATGTGLVDLVLPPEQMPSKLIQYFQHSAFLENGRKLEVSKGTPQEIEEVLPKVFNVLRDRTGHDFSHYKTSTIKRRIERRMSLHQITDISNYLRYLRNNPGEINALFSELLIGVTNFFRDPEAFDALKEKVLAKVLSELGPKSVFRVWVPGCSTGEEVYSLVMALQESMDALDRNVKLQVFGTDIDNLAINKARDGLYLPSIVSDISKERLGRFFLLEDEAYRVRQEIREPVVFSVQDVMRDPPFSKLDLLCCRNLLIYLDNEAQKRLLPLFHYTLKPGGILFLGSSESIGGFNDLFTVVDKKWKIYRRKEITTANHRLVDFPTGPLADAAMDIPGGGALLPDQGIDLSWLTNEVLLKQYTPACVVIDPKGEISYFHGHTGKYLEPASGRATLNVLSMAREGLRLELATAIRKVEASGKPWSVKGVRVKTNGGYQYLDLTVKPLTGQKPMQGHLLVVFEEAPQPRKPTKDVQLLNQEVAERVMELEKELQITREKHQTAIEELETTNEELKSINEEMQSANEELQSTNEELEASKEEQQSLNEELTTVNAELQAKVDELVSIQDDMQNLLESTKIATIFLDGNLQIKNFTPEATTIFNLIRSDIGRPLEHLVSNLDYPRLVSDAKEVIDSLVSKEQEVITNEGKWFGMRIVPYRTKENMIDGVVLTFADIDLQKKSQKVLRASRDFAQSIVDTVREPLLVLGQDLTVRSANRSFYELFQVLPRETVGNFIYNLGDGQWDIPELRNLLEKIIPQNNSFEEYPVEHDFPKVGFKRMLLNARRFRRTDTGEYWILLAMDEMV